MTGKVKFPLENWLWGTVTFTSTAILLPLFLLSRLPAPELGVPALAIFTSVLYSSGRLSLLALRGSKTLLNLTFWLFAYVWLGVAPLVQVAAEEFPWSGSYSEGTLVLAAVIVVAGYVSYDLGAWLGSRYDGYFVNRALPVRLSFSKRRIYLLAPLSLAIVAFAVFKTGGIQSVFAYRSDFSGQVLSEFGTTSGVLWQSLLRWPTLVALLLALWAWFNRRLLNIRGWERLMLRAVIPILLVVTLVVDNPVKSPRFVVGVVALSLVFVLLRWNQRRSIGALILGSTAVLLLVFPYADLFRHEDTTLTLRSVSTQLALNGDYDAFQALANTVEFVFAEGFELGWQLLGVFLFWVPRAVWPGKPEGSGLLIAEQSGYSFTNTAASLWAEAYINGGLLLVFIIFFFYGAISSVLQAQYLGTLQSRLSAAAVVVPLFAAYQIYLIRGELIGTVSYAVFILAFLLLAVKRVTPRKKAAVAATKDTRGVDKTFDIRVGN